MEKLREIEGLLTRVSQSLKFPNFSTTLILREINLGIFGVPKVAIEIVLETIDLDL